MASAVSEGAILATKVPGASALATLAYSLYLTHKSVAHAVHHLLPGVTAQPGWRSSCIYAFACIAVASLLYLGVERPFIALRVRRSARQATAAAVNREVRLDPAL